MNPLSFTNSVVSVVQPLQNLMQTTPRNNQATKMYDMQVDDTELRLLVADLYQHMDLRPRENARVDAHNILQYMNQEQAYQLAQQKFVERQYAYTNGSVLERFRRAIGGNPMAPVHPSIPVQQQPMYQMPQQLGYNPYQQQQAPAYPAPVSSTQDMEIESLKQGMQELKTMMASLVQQASAPKQ
jgi:hypothetical protein